MAFKQEQYLYLTPHSRLVAGLHWQYLPLRGSRGMRMRAREERASHWVAVPLSDGTLLGTLSLTEISPARGKPLASLALQLQPRLPADGYAVFALPDGRYWFSAAHGGRLSMFADVVGDEAAVRSAAGRFIQATPEPDAGWSVIAPEGFFPTLPVRTLTLTALLEAKRLRHARLHTTQNRRARLGQVALLVAAVGGYGLWHQHQARQAQAHIAAARAALLAEQRRPDTGQMSKPWAGTLQLPVILARCEAAWRQAPISIAGWAFNAADCAGDGALTLHYRLPAGGTVGDFAARAPRYYPDIPTVFNIPGGADDAALTLSIPLPSPAPPEILPAGDVQIRNLTSYAQRLGAQLRLAQEPPLTQTAGDQVVTLPWRLYSFTFITAIPPDRLFAPSRFDSRGMRLTHISTALADSRLIYTLEGTLYANH